jgi:K(+)-stimulated pyrophosphate-energized sodium pump
MREVSELIYETCKTYLATQGKFLMLLECFIGVIIVFYFGFLQGRRLIRSSSSCCSA